MVKPIVVESPKNFELVKNFGRINKVVQQCRIVLRLRRRENLTGINFSHRGLNIGSVTKMIGAMVNVMFVRESLLVDITVGVQWANGFRALSISNFCLVELVLVTRSTF